MAGKPYVFYKPKGKGCDVSDEPKEPKDRIECSEPSFLNFGFVYPYGAFDDVSDGSGGDHVSSEFKYVVDDIN
tara:strand:- start:1515 stop:1733 length:219 start_codon:yes stop_codon:yes gene_type:complete